MATEGHAAVAVAGAARRRVLFFPLPFQGHISPMFHLAGVLHARGFAVTVFYPDFFNAPDPSRHPAFDFVPVPDGRVGRGDGDGAGGDYLQATMASILALNRRCEAPFWQRLAALLESSGGDVACLVADAHLLTLMDVARRLGVPALALRTGSAASFRIFAAQPMLRDEGYLPARESELDAPVTVLPPAPYRVRDVTMTAGVGGHAQEQIYEIMSRAVAAVKTSSGLILNTFHALESAELAALRRDFDVPVFDVGPLHKLSPAGPAASLLRQDRGCLEWLDAQSPASVLYVSFGSIASMNAAELVETAWGIANSGHPFLWVLRPDLVRGGAAQQAAAVGLPDGFDTATRGRGAVVSWAPQDEVLAHRAVGGFWTHCGWNSTLESVCAGVPMLLRPCFGDQPGNARYAEHVWRVGLTLDTDGGGELERGKVESAIRRLMEGEDGAGMRRRAGELKSGAAECIAMAGSSCLSIDKLVNHILSL
ncbi:DIMBOA UDP-glucosyltransferase BX8-like [Oryza brachyantha]|uniref:DIMBOA UDP-glucosyltransferase BX8-like n=1 Tax=Oryza brachyantha TaxID=4533 RepID=UPI001ADAF991|nr:DIMBOA UDP-glucosyltransferase BX8-like [Oryza brachyantha]